VDKSTAQQILTSYRPGLDNQHEPGVAEALAFVQTDPQLKNWYQNFQEFHTSARSDFRSLPVPSGLRARILTQETKIIPLWRRPEVWLVAAGLAVALVISALWAHQLSREDESLRGFQSRMIGFALREYRMDVLTSDGDAVRKFLRHSGAPADYALTPALRAMPVKGGASLAWQTNPVGMVCFNLPKDQTLYLFVVDQKAIHQGNIPGPKPALAPVHGILTASWSAGGKVYLAAAADASVVERIARID
jgi:hypothetical protein